MIQECEDKTKKTCRWEYPKRGVMKANGGILHPIMLSFFFFNVTISLLLWLVCFHDKELTWLTTLCRLNKWAFVELCGGMKLRHNSNPETLHDCFTGANEPRRTLPRISPLPSSTHLSAERLLDTESPRRIIRSKWFSNFIHTWGCFFPQTQLLAFTNEGHSLSLRNVALTRSMTLWSYLSICVFDMLAVIKSGYTLGSFGKDLKCFPCSSHFLEPRPMPWSCCLWFSCADVLRITARWYSCPLCPLGNMFHVTQVPLRLIQGPCR